MLPHVILHVGMSADGRLDWGVGDEGLYYELAARFKAEAMLTGSRTMLAAYASPDPPQADDEAPAVRELHPLHVPLLVVVDSRGQVRTWSQIKKEPYWRDALAVCSHSTPQDHLDYLRQRRVETIVEGDDRVDLRAALEELHARYGVKTVRVDSGGTTERGASPRRAGETRSVCLSPPASWEAQRRARSLSRQTWLLRRASSHSS